MLQKLLSFHAIFYFIKNLAKIGQNKNKTKIFRSAPTQKNWFFTLLKTPINIIQVKHM